MKRLFKISPIAAWLMLLPFVLHGATGQTDVGNLFFSEISVKDGLSQGFVHSITKDSRGFMWFGTSGGLNCYDGYGFTIYKYNETDSLSLCGNLVNCIAEDGDGFLWVGTGNGLCRFDSRTDTFTRYRHIASDDGSVSGDYVKSLLVDSKKRLWVGADGALNLYDPENDSFLNYDCDGLLEGTRIYDLLEDRRGTIWLATRDAGLIAFDPETGFNVRYLHDGTDPYSISSNHVNCLYEDSRGMLWIGTWEHGINVYDRRRDVFLKIAAHSDGKTPNSNQIRCLSEDSSGRMWIGTSDGLSIYEPATGLYRYCKRHNDVPGTLSYNIVNCIFPDNTGAVWLGTHGGGVSLYHPALGQFGIIDPKMETGRDYGYIGPMAEIDGNIWVGTEGGGLGCWNPSSGKYSFYDIRKNGGSDSGGNVVRALCADGDGMLWVGTYASGVTVFNPRSHRAERHFGEADGLDNSIINEIFIDADGTVWVGSNSDAGLYRKKAGEDRFTRFVSEFESGSWGSGNTLGDFPWIRSICRRRNGELWMGSISSGVLVVRPGNTSVHFSIRNSRLSSNSVSCVFEDSECMLWVGTYGGGVNKYDSDTGEFTIYDSSCGLPNDNVCSILEDAGGRIWIGTMAGLSVYDKATGSFSTYSYSKGSFPIETLNLKSGLYSSDGHLYFGGSNGIAEFDPESLCSGPEASPVVITAVNAGGRAMRPSDKLALDWRHSDFTVEFAALNYVNAKNNNYSFILEGYDREWSEGSERRQAKYTNLPPGDYVFRVRAGNGSSLRNDAETSFGICILPPPWRSWWAYVLYVLLSVTVVIVVVQVSVSRVRRRNELRVKELERETKERMHQEQMNVFTNFSHELRTPLTLILDPLRNILVNENLSDSLRKSLKLIQANAGRILALVNQLMDFRRQDSGQMKLQARVGDMLSFVNDMAVIFNEQARAKSIRIEVRCDERRVSLRFDPFLMEKVFFNLLSNAVKNTPSGGSIVISLSCAASIPDDIRRHRPSGTVNETGLVFVEVRDSGPGIPESDLERVFAPFYRVDERLNGDHYGTGIGLHLAESIVKMHGGSIWAENVPESGAAFRMLFPCDASSCGDAEPVASVEKIPGPVSDESITDAVGTVPGQRSRRRVLIVDDNADIRSYISDFLKNEYDVREAENGASGLEKARELQPDLVICDIIMPEMDGLEMLRRLKSEPSTSHIPVILLTARSTTDQTKEGLRCGADDYVTKPFDMPLLKTRVDSLIENRVRLKEMFLKGFNLKLTGGEMNHTDRYFLSKAYDYVKEHLADENLSIEGFGSSLHLSRTQLYRKIKALTGLSPSAFVSTLRLKVAASLLLETNLSVSEVAYKVGFSSPSYFTTSFRRLYGVSPKEYVTRRPTE